MVNASVNVPFDANDVFWKTWAAEMRLVGIINLMSFSAGMEAYWKVSLYALFII